MADALTPDELRDLLATLLAGAAGGAKATWREKVGPVATRPILEDIRSNWRVSPKGDADDLTAIGKAVDVVRTANPYVRDEAVRARSSIRGIGALFTVLTTAVVADLSLAA